MVSPTTTYSQAYTSKPGVNQVTITLINPGDFFINQKGSQANSINYGTIGTNDAAVSFTVCSNCEYVPALVETQYDPVKLASDHKVYPPSYCHIYFKVNQSRWCWSTSPQTADNPTIFVRGQGEHTHAEIDIQLPTAQNPGVTPSLLPSLNSELVFLLDKNTNGNMLFRGNEPLCPGMTNQSVDFNTLHNALANAYALQTGDPSGFPKMGEYILRDIAFLDPNPDDEGTILAAEISSFGATQNSQVSQQWYSATSSLGPLPNSTMIGQVANWNVEPSSNEGANLSLDVEFVEKLCSWMNTVLQYPAGGSDIPTVYYIHCSSGHDRTGMMSSAYLIKQYGFDASTAFIMGTTLNKLPQPPAGNLVPDCYDVGTSTIDTQRSRCFLAGNGTMSTYNNTVVDIYNKINPAKQIKALSAEALCGDPAINPAPPPSLPTPFVCPNYPWQGEQRLWGV